MKNKALNSLLPNFSTLVVWLENSSKQKPIQCYSFLILYSLEIITIEMWRFLMNIKRNLEETTQNEKTAFENTEILKSKATRRSFYNLKAEAKPIGFCPQPNFCRRTIWLYCSLFEMLRNDSKIPCIWLVCIFFRTFWTIWLQIFLKNWGSWTFGEWFTRLVISVVEILKEMNFIFISHPFYSKSIAFSVAGGLLFQNFFFSMNSFKPVMSIKKLHSS